MTANRSRCLSFFLCLASLILVLLVGCGGDDPAGPVGNDGPGTLPGDPDGILLPGDDTANAVDSLRDMPPSAVPDEEIVDGLHTTRLMAWLSAEATVQDLNGALERYGARIVSMSAGHPLLTLVVPAVADRAAAETLATQLMTESALVAVIPSEAARAEPSVADKRKAMPTDEDMPGHLESLRAPAAWNALARAQALNHVIPVLVPDSYHDDVPMAEIPSLSFPADLTGITDPQENHGAHITGTIGALHGGSAAVGAHPAPALADLTGILIDGLTWAEILTETINHFPTDGNFVVNTSLAWGVDEQAAATNGGNWTAQQLFEGAILAMSWRLQTFSDTYRFVHATAAGNEGEHAGNMKDGRISSPWTVARFQADPRGMFEEGDLQEGHVAALDHLVNIYAANAPWVVSIQPNIIVVGSSDSAGDESAFSSQGSEIRVQGENVLSSCGVTGQDGCDGQIATMQGTSMATPQVAAMAAWLWNLSPALDSDGVIERLLHCYNQSELTGIADAYMLALSADQSLAAAEVRRSILDVAGTAPAPGTNFLFDEADLELYLTFFESFEAAGGENTEVDYSRYDLNGDGITGQSLAVFMDLNVDVLPLFSEVSFQASDNTITLDETAVTDREALCYYAYSELYDGDEEARNDLMAYCRSSIEIEVEGWQSAMSGTAENEFTVIVLAPDDQGVLPVEGALVGLSAVGGILSTNLGFTDADGRLAATATFADGSDLIELTIDVEVGDDTAQRQLQCVRQTGSVVVLENTSLVWASASVSDLCNNWSREFPDAYEPFDFQLSYECSGFAQGEDHSAAVSVVGTMEWDLVAGTDELQGMSVVASGSASKTATGLASAGAQVYQAVAFQVWGAAVQFTATGTMQSGDALNDGFRLVPDGDWNNNVYFVRGRDGDVLELDESGVLPPGRYILWTDLTIHDWFSGDVEFEITFTP